MFTAVQTKQTSLPKTSVQKASNEQGYKGDLAEKLTQIMHHPKLLKREK